jgi:hypothetical protein
VNSIFQITIHLCKSQKVNCSGVLNTGSHHEPLTSGASPTIHLQSGEKASGPLHSRSSTASPRLGTRCSICSSRTWKWSQSSGRIRSSDDSTLGTKISLVTSHVKVKPCPLLPTAQSIFNFPFLPPSVSWRVWKMWEPQCLTILWAYMACYRAIF